jgi:hypothetical protein
MSVAAKDVVQAPVTSSPAVGERSLWASPSTSSRDFGAATGSLLAGLDFRPQRSPETAERRPAQSSQNPGPSRFSD